MCSNLPIIVASQVQCVLCNVNRNKCNGLHKALSAETEEALCRQNVLFYWTYAAYVHCLIAP